MVPPHRSWLNPLRCPNCSAALISEADSLACGDCARRYPMDQGLIDFRLADGRTANATPAAPFPLIKAPTPQAWVDAVREFLTGRDDAEEGF